MFLKKNSYNERDIQDMIDFLNRNLSYRNSFIKKVPSAQRPYIMDCLDNGWAESLEQGAVRRKFISTYEQFMEELNSPKTC